MSQSQVWKKRSAVMASELKDQTRNWLNPKDDERQVLAVAHSGQRKAGLKRRKF